MSQSVLRDAVRVRCGGDEVDGGDGEGGREMAARHKEETERPGDFRGSV